MSLQPTVRPGTFPPGFLWGAATSAYQIEGATTVDGRGPSIWDTFAHTPGTILDSSTGDDAVQHYERYREDIALLAELEIPAYRFSVAWPRVQPSGRGPLNQAGLDFYDRLVDELLSREIRPALTLYHWDLPQPLQNLGGWAERSTALRFAEYAAAMAARLGDRVRLWSTLNEPWCSAFLGHASGVHAPGIQDAATSLRAVHHLLLGHGLAVRALREVLPAMAEISLVINPTQVGPATQDPADLAAVNAVDAVANRVFLDPVFHGRYPEEVERTARELGVWQVVEPEDLAIISSPIDWLGVNYYTAITVQACPEQDTDLGELVNYPGVRGVRVLPSTAPRTAMDWPIEPSGLLTLLERLHRDLPGVPLMVTENGAAFTDPLDQDRVRDDDRIDYLHQHLSAVQTAIESGIDVRGYFVWSLLDNFEWAYGYSQRFGIVHVDFRTQQRLPKDSAWWYREVIRTNAVPETQP